MQYNFEWDYKKAKDNYKKHKVAFERAAEIFLDPFMLSIYDGKHSSDEDRWITVGKDRNDVTLVVVHTFRGIDPYSSSIRIISVRKATKYEIKQYIKR